MICSFKITYPTPGRSTRWLVAGFGYDRPPTISSPKVTAPVDLVWVLSWLDVAVTRTSLARIAPASSSAEESDTVLVAFPPPPLVDGPPVADTLKRSARSNR